MVAPSSTPLHTASALVRKRVADPDGSRVRTERVGEYQIVDRIAVGGMAEIFKARKQGDHGFAKLFALKKILPHLANDRASVEMFLDEARITASLEHPKIIQAFELGNDADSLYFAMEYVDGIDVLQLLQNCARAQIRLPATLAALIARDVLDALDYAHEARDTNGRSLAIVHRDVSPSNVLLSWQGDVKLTDFGVALAARRRHQTAQHTLRGKYGYMSPEQVSGGHVDGRSDLFSVGVMLAEMVMARRLFVGPTDLDVLLAVRDVKLDRLDAHASEFPLELLAIVIRALQVAPRDRWQTAGEMRDAIDTWLAQCERATSQELAAFVATVTRAPTAMIDPNTSSIFVRAVNPMIPLGAVKMQRRALPGLAPVVDTEEIELTDLDALEVIDEGDDVFNAITADGLQVEKILREADAMDRHQAITARAPAMLVEALARPTAKVHVPAVASRHSAIAIATADILLDDDEVEIDDRPTEQDLFSAFDFELGDDASGGRPVGTPAPKQREKAITGLVATVPRRKKQHTVETALASLVEESQVLELPRSRAARGTGRFTTPQPVPPRITLPLRAPSGMSGKQASGTPRVEAVGTPPFATLDEAIELASGPHHARRPSTGVPVRDQLPLPPRRPTTEHPHEPVMLRRTRRTETSLSVVAHTPVPLKGGKLGRMNSVGKLGEFANYSDADIAESLEREAASKPARIKTGKLVLETLAKVTGMHSAVPEPESYVLATPGGTSVHDEAPSLVSRVKSPLGILALLTLAMFAVFLLAMYGVL